MKRADEYPSGLAHVPKGLNVPNGTERVTLPGTKCPEFGKAGSQLHGTGSRLCNENGDSSRAAEESRPEGHNKRNGRQAMVGYGKVADDSGVVAWR